MTLPDPISGGGPPRSPEPTQGPTPATGPERPTDADAPRFDVNAPAPAPSIRPVPDAPPTAPDLDLARLQPRLEALRAEGATDERILDELVTDELRRAYGSGADATQVAEVAAAVARDPVLSAAFRRLLASVP